MRQAVEEWACCREPPWKRLRAVFVDIPEEPLPLPTTGLEAGEVQRNQLRFQVDLHIVSIPLATYMLIGCHRNPSAPGGGVTTIRVIP